MESSSSRWILPTEFWSKPRGIISRRSSTRKASEKRGLLRDSWAASSRAVEMWRSSSTKSDRSQPDWIPLKSIAWLSLRETSWSYLAGTGLDRGADEHHSSIPMTQPYAAWKFIVDSRSSGIKQLHFPRPTTLITLPRRYWTRPRCWRAPLVYTNDRVSNSSISLKEWVLGQLIKQFCSISTRFLRFSAWFYIIDN
jgi:hypothetical protein